MVSSPVARVVCVCQFVADLLRYLFCLPERGNFAHQFEQKFPIAGVVEAKARIGIARKGFEPLRHGHRQRFPRENLAWILAELGEHLADHEITTSPLVIIGPFAIEFAPVSADEGDADQIPADKVCEFGVDKNACDVSAAIVHLVPVFRINEITCGRQACPGVGRVQSVNATIVTELRACASVKSLRVAFEAKVTGDALSEGHVDIKVAAEGATTLLDQ